MVHTFWYNNCEHFVFLPDQTWKILNLVTMEVFSTDTYFKMTLDVITSKGDLASNIYLTSPKDEQMF